MNNEGRVAFRFHVKNIGRTPAMGVWIESKVHIDFEIQPQHAYAALAARTRQRPLTLGYTIFPDEDMIQDVSLSISTDDLNTYFRKRGKDGWKEEIAVLPILIGCVDYGLVVEGERRQTGFIYRIDRNPAMSEVIAIGPAFGSVPLNQLRLTSWPVGGGTIAD
jgi:hypothetical protein